MEYLEEDQLGFDPDEEGDMEDYSGSEEEGEEGSSQGAPSAGRAGGGAYVPCLL